MVLYTLKQTMKATKFEQKKETSRLPKFFLGISLISIGLIFAIAINPAFFSILALGLCIIAISLAKKEKWNKTNKKNASNNHGRSEVN